MGSTGQSVLLLNGIENLCSPDPSIIGSLSAPSGKTTSADVFGGTTTSKQSLASPSSPSSSNVHAPTTLPNGVSTSALAHVNSPPTTGATRNRFHPGSIAWSPATRSYRNLATAPSA